MKQVTAVIGGGLLVVLLTAGAAPPAKAVRVSVTPRVALEPTTFFVSVVTQPHADNRMLKISADSESFSTSSDRQLEGEDSPRVATFEFRGVPAGHYDIRAVVIGANGQPRAEADASATVIGIDQNP